MSEADPSMFLLHNDSGLVTASVSVNDGLQRWQTGSCPLLQHLASGTRLDIAIAVNALGRYNKRP